MRLEYDLPVCKTMQNWHVSKKMDQGNTGDSPKTDPITCGNLVYDKGNISDN